MLEPNAEGFHHLLSGSSHFDPCRFATKAGRCMAINDFSVYPTKAHNSSIRFNCSVVVTQFLFSGVDPHTLFEETFTDK
jgi:hypothetical protein